MPTTTELLLTDQLPDEEAYLRGVLILWDTPPVWRRIDLDAVDFDDPPTCSICDGVGHGYPGAGPCPLEVTDYSSEPWWAV